jgi:hypothetical protein
MQNRNVPYKSQWDADAVKSRNDCGPASIAMILNYYGENLTTDQVFEKTGAGQGLINLDQMVKAIKAFGYEVEVKYECTPESLRALIDHDLPPIALVHYGSLQSRQDQSFSGGHFFAVVGYRDDVYFVNDPNFRNNFRQDGDHHAYTKKEFEAAWNDARLDQNPVRTLIVIKRKQASTEIYYKGYDLTNKDSMKVAVDILLRVQNGEFVDKPKYEELQKKVTELEQRPPSCPPQKSYEAEKQEIRKILDRIS